eukprot:6357101-Amphidinium_carterae.1
MYETICRHMAYEVTRSVPAKKQFEACQSIRCIGKLGFRIHFIFTGPHACSGPGTRGSSGA